MSELDHLSKSMLLTLAIDLDPDLVEELTREQMTKEELIRRIKREVEKSVGQSKYGDTPLIIDSKVVDMQELPDTNEEVESNWRSY